MPRYTGIGYFLSHLQQTGRRGLLASQLHELHPVIFPTQAFNLSFKDSIKIMFPIQPEAGFRHVLRCEHGVWWCFGSRESYDRVSSGLRSNAPSFGCWLGTKPSTVCSFVLRSRLLAPRFSFLLRWFRRVPRRNHPVPLLPAWCLRHHRSPQPVEVRHRHDYFASTFAAAQTGHHLGAGIHIRVRESHWLSSHCTFLPVRAVQVTATPLLAGPSSHQLLARSFQWHSVVGFWTKTWASHR